MVATTIICQSYIIVYKNVLLNKTHVPLAVSATAGLEHREGVSYLVFWVVDHWWFPFAIHLIIPVFWFLGLWVWNVLGLVPVLWLRVLWVVKLLPVVPILRLLRVGILDLLGGQEVPVVIELSTLLLLVVDLDFVRVVGTDDQSVEVRQDIILKSVITDFMNG